MVNKKEQRGTCNKCKINRQVFNTAYSLIYGYDILGQRSFSMAQKNHNKYESSSGWTVLISCFETSLPKKPRLVSRLESSFCCFPSIEVVGLHLSSSTWLQSTCKIVPNLLKNSELFQKVSFYLDLEKHPALYSSCNLLSVLIQIVSLGDSLLGQHLHLLFYFPRSMATIYN